MLGFAREVAPYGVPLVGINQGRLGFITDIPADQYREALTPILAGDFETEQRSMLEGAVWRDGQNIFSGLALNDVVVSRGAAAGMVELRIHVGEEFVANVRADGVIVASPTGSTAYCLECRRAAAAPVHRRLGDGADCLARPVQPPHRASGHWASSAWKWWPAATPAVNFDMQALTHVQHGDRVTVQRSQHRMPSFCTPPAGATTRPCAASSAGTRVAPEFLNPMLRRLCPAGLRHRPKS